MPWFLIVHDTKYSSAYRACEGIIDLPSIGAGLSALGSTIEANCISV